MVFKKIKFNPKKARRKSKSSHVRDLTDYVRGVRLRAADEKVLYSGARGFLTTDHVSQQAEMIALAMEAIRSPNPLSHYLLSWREGEQPTPEQVEQAVSLFLGELGLDGHQVIYGLHQNTENIHLHIVVNRVHPDSQKVIKPQKGFDIEAGHRAIALIEFHQGWAREANGRYQILATGEVTREQPNGRSISRVSQPALDVENQTGTKSAERIGIEECAPIIRAAQTWAELHVRLAEIGVRFERKGSGAVIFVGGVAIKASSVGRDKRDCSLGALQKRLGPFEPALVAPQERLEQPINSEGKALRWDEYHVARTDHYARKRQDITQQRARHLAERDALRERQRTDRRNAFRGSWRGKGSRLNAARSLVAARHAAELAALRDQQAMERKELYRRYPGFPSVEEWLRLTGDPDLADAWRYRDYETAGFSGNSHELPVPQDIRAFMAEIVGGSVFYARTDDGDPAFVDIGPRVDVLAETAEDAVVAAMQLATKKWGILHVNGTPEYKELCIRLAIKHGFRLSNPGFQQKIEAGRQRSNHRSWRAINRVHQVRAFPAVQGNDPYVSIYRSHFDDIARRQLGKIDLSRIDSMIAVRLRATNHSRSEIEEIIRKCAPMARSRPETRDWGAYASRAARYAFGVEGSKKIQTASRLRKQLNRPDSQVSIPSLVRY